MRKNPQNDSDRIRTSALATAITEYLDSQRPRCRPATVEAWDRALGNLQGFLAAQGRHRPQDVTAADLETWRLTLGAQEFAPASLELYGRTARQFFAWLEGTQRLFINPASTFVVPRPQRAQVPVLTPEQIDKLLSQPDPATPCGVRDRALLETAYGTGLMVGELLDLRAQDVTGNSVQVRGNKKRNLALSDRATEWLRRYVDEARLKLLGLKPATPALWLTVQGAPLSNNTLEQTFRRHSVAAGLGAILPCAVRRACAVHRWQNGADPIELQIALGYASLRTLAQYMRMTISELNKGKEHHETAVA